MYFSQLQPRAGHRRGDRENPSILTAPELAELAPLSLEAVLERDGYLFLRYALSL